MGYKTNKNLIEEYDELIDDHYELIEDNYNLIKNNFNYKESSDLHKIRIINYKK